MLKEDLKKWIDIAAGREKAPLVLKSARIVNVFTHEIETGDIAIDGDRIVGIGCYQGMKEIDLKNCFVCPGFIDGHIHLESSMLSASEFEKAVVPHGTTAVITDPHEIANVAGSSGIRYMMDMTENLYLNVYFMMPSCVPSSPFDEAGAILNAEDLNTFYSDPRVLGLAEMMNFYGTVAAQDDILDKIIGARICGGRIDGHAPGLAGKQIDAYCVAGVLSDHECSDTSEAIEKMRRGQWIMIREGTAAHNLEALMPLCHPPYCSRCLFVTDDKHPGDLIRMGHMDAILRKAVSLGADPIDAVKMCTLQTAQYFGLKEQGAVSPGYIANLVVVQDLKEFKVNQVMINGILVAENGKMLHESPVTKEDYPMIMHSFHLEPVKKEDFVLKGQGDCIRVIGLVKHELLTEELIMPFVTADGTSAGVDLSRDVVKMAVFERHHFTGHKGIGFLHGYGLKCGAIATSVAHDSHNLIVAGVNDDDMVLAANTVREQEGGLAVVQEGRVLGSLPLPVAGLMSQASINEVDAQLEQLKAFAREMGVSEDIDPFMTLAFSSLPVIPKLRLNGHGLIDVNQQAIVNVFLQKEE